MASDTLLRPCFLPHFTTCGSSAGWSSLKNVTHERRPAALCVNNALSNPWTSLPSGSLILRAKTTAAGLSSVSQMKQCSWPRLGPTDTRAAYGPGRCPGGSPETHGPSAPCDNGARRQGDKETKKVPRLAA